MIDRRFDLVMPADSASSDTLTAALLAGELKGVLMFKIHDAGLANDVKALHLAFDTFEQEARYCLEMRSGKLYPGVFTFTELLSVDQTLFALGTAIFERWFTDG